jgi:prephenate dehydrogenase
MKIAILGAGNMGRWLVRELAPDHEVCVHDSIPSRMEGLDRIAIARDMDGIAAFGPGLLINAVSLKNTIAAFEAAVPVLPPDCILADVASVKGAIPDYYRSLPGLRFASLHPMFGPTFANISRLEDENVIIIRESDPDGARFFREFFRAKRIRIHEYSFEQHDRLIAYSLALPFASTMVFAACMNSATVPGTTFKKHLEIAKGLLSEDDDLLAEIIFSPHSLAQLEGVTSRLEFLKHIIRARDADEAVAFFESLRHNLRSTGIPFS